MRGRSAGEARGGRGRWPGPAEGGAAGGRTQRKAARPPSHQSSDSVSQDSRERALGRRAGSPGDRRTADTARAPRRPLPLREGPHCGRRLAEAQSVLRPRPRAPGSPQDRARGRLDESGDCERRRSARPCPGALSARGRGVAPSPKHRGPNGVKQKLKDKMCFPLLGTVAMTTDMLTASRALEIVPWLRGCSALLRVGRCRCRPPGCGPRSSRRRRGTMRAGKDGGVWGRKPAPGPRP